MVNTVEFSTSDVVDTFILPANHALDAGLESIRVAGFLLEAASGILAQRNDTEGEVVVLSSFLEQIAGGVEQLEDQVEGIFLTFINDESAADPEAITAHEPHLTIVK